MHLLIQMQRYHAGEICLLMAAALILIDYFFATDWPAHWGYFLIGVATFFCVWSEAPGSAWNLRTAAGVAAGAWIVLAILHQLVFRKFLENAVDTDREPVDTGEASP